jgi:hypothetical protein
MATGGKSEDIEELSSPSTAESAEPLGVESRTDNPSIALRSDLLVLVAGYRIVRIALLK